MTKLIPTPVAKIKIIFALLISLFFTFSTFAQKTNLKPIQKKGASFTVKGQENVDNGKYSLQLDSIKKSYNQAKLTELYNEFSERNKIQKEEVKRYALLNNIPIRFEDEFGATKELQFISEEGTPIYYTTFNADAAISTRANYLNTGGGLGLNLDGDNLTAHVWDAGLARSTHQEYDGAGGNNRFSTGDGTNTLNFHSAHVTGTIMASGVQAQAKGMAWKANAIGYDWNNDAAEATTAAANGMLVSNHSYGFDATAIPNDWFGQYGSYARDWDAIMYNAPYYLMMVAAGNDGNDNTANASPLDGNSSYDKLSGRATAKNNMVVANGQDANINGDGSLGSVTINSSSSEGPTDDYRIKPDITGNGTGLYSTYETSDNVYASITGTSMASPNVTGTLLLLQEHYNNLNGNLMRAATLKGLALHTADDAGPNGPDAVYGWGLLNAKKAAETLTTAAAGSGSAIVSELTLSQGQTYQITVQSNGVDPLMASVSWTDPAGALNGGLNSNTPALVNDLDLRLNNGTNYTPWRLTGVTTNGTGDNIVDPFERVDVNSASGQYTLTVTHKGTLSSGSQNYSLIVTGIVVASTPVISFSTTIGNTIESTDCNFTDIDVTLNIGQAPSADAVVTFSVNAGSTGTLLLDFDLLTPSVTFLTGQTTPQTMSLRVYHDGFVEVDETAIIDFTVNANGGDATADTNADTYTLTINDDDNTPVISTNITLLSEDFESVAWASLDGDGDGNDWLGLTGLTYTGITGNFPGSETDLTILGNGAGTANANNYLISPQMNIPSSTINVNFEFGVGGYLSIEHYAVYWTTDVSSAATINSGILLEERNSLANAGEIRIVSNSAIAGQTGYFVVRHFNSAANNGILLFDNITIIANVATSVQTAVNTGSTNDSQALASAGTIYTNDSATGNVMLDITNNQADDYGCVDISVSRAGTGAQSYNGSVAPNLAMDKVFTMSHSNAVPTGDVSVTFYFTEAEIAGWEAATGGARANLLVGREVGGTITEISTLTIGAFGANVTLTGTLTGLDGDFYFGAAGVIEIGTCGGGTTTWTGNPAAWDNGAPTNTMNAIIDGVLYSTASGSLDVCSLQISNNALLLIGAGDYVKVEEDITVDSGSTLNIEHEGSLVQVNDDATVTKNGNIVVNKETTNVGVNGFSILGSPMSASTREGVYGNQGIVRHHITANFVPHPVVATYDPGAENFADDNGNDWVTHTGAINPGEGYLVTSTDASNPNLPITSVYNTGILNNGVITYNTGFNTNPNASPNILANPYASSIDANTLINNNNTIIDAIYYWEHITENGSDPNYPGYKTNNYDMGDISVYTLSGGVAAANNSGGAKPSNQYIPSGQGFGIKALAAGTVTFNNSMRITGPNDNYRNSEISIERLYISIKNEAYGLKSGALIAFTENATDEGYDSGYEAKRLATPVSIYSVLDEYELAIQGRSVFTTDQVIPLGFRTMVEENQNYTISLGDIEGANISQATVYLQDNLLNIVTNLSEGNYTFSSNESNQKDRFVIVFADEQLGNTDVQLEAVSVYPNPTNSIITISSPLAEINSVEVYDVRGRKVKASIKLSQTTCQIDISSLESAMYFVKISTLQGTITKRVLKN